MRSEGEMTILDHLEDFRKMLLRSALALLLGMLACIPFIRIILRFLFQPLMALDVDPHTFLIAPQVMGGFRVAVSVVFWSGLLLASPFIVFFVAQFIFPGLHKNEKRLVRRSSGVAVLLFFAGASLGYFGTIRHALDALIFGIHRWMGTSAEWIFLTDYIGFVTRLTLGFGLAFQLPLLVLILGYADLIDSSTLRAHRRHTFVGLLIMAMLLTPPEPVSQLAMACSLYLLFELCILLLRRHEKKSLHPTGGFQT